MSSNDNTSILIKFRAGDARAVPFVTYLAGLTPHEYAPAFSHFMFWRAHGGVMLVELHLTVNMRDRMTEMAKTFGAYVVTEGSFDNNSTVQATA